MDNSDLSDLEKRVVRALEALSPAEREMMLRILEGAAFGPRPPDLGGIEKFEYDL